LIQSSLQLLRVDLPVTMAVGDKEVVAKCIIDNSLKKTFLTTIFPHSHNIPPRTLMSRTQRPRCEKNQDRMSADDPQAIRACPTAKTPAYYLCAFLSAPYGCLRVWEGV
jgi:hypothetical protein